VRVSKATYKDRKGKTRESSKWYCEFRDHLETVRRLPLFKDRKQTETAGRNIEKLVACRVNHQAPDVELGRWLETLPSTLREKLAKCGLLDAQTATSHKGLAEHLADFQAALEAKGNTAKQIGMTLQRIRRVFDGCGFKTWLDVRAGKVDSWLAEQRKPTKDSRGLSIQSSNHYLKACKQFARWMVASGRASQSPLAHLKALNVATDRRHDRRALSADESRRLIVAAQNGPERFGMAGAERALVYRLALESGLRANEIASLTRRSFRFGTKLATVVVEAGNSKHRERDELPLRPDTADLLKAHLATKLPQAKAFAMPRIDDVAGMMRADLDAARTAWLKEAGNGSAEREARERSDFLVYQDSEGLFADFHALRHTFVSSLALAGVPVKLAQSLARHKDPRLTLARYAHVELSDQFEALEALPDLSATMPVEQRATGTDDATAGVGVLSDCYAMQ
jgi:integrase